MRPIAIISDDHLEMLTRIRVRAVSRAEARQRIFVQASFIMETLQGIMDQPYPHQLPIATLLQDTEQHMQDLLEEIGGLCVEEQHDSHITTTIWGETGESHED